MATRFHHPAVDDINLDRILAALADPARRQILIKLMDSGGLCCNEACTDLPPSTVSFHHRVLREAGLIHSEKRGVQVINQVRKADLESRFPGLLELIIRHHSA